MILCAIRNNRDGTYIPFNEVIEQGKHYGVPVIPISPLKYGVDYNTTKELVQKVKKVNRD